MRATCSTRFAEPWVVPMATEVKLPRLGQGMESGTIVQWLKSEGEQIAKGEPLYEVDTEKVTQEVVAEDAERAGTAPAPAAAPAVTPPAPGEVESIPLTGVRRTIARRLTAAWQVPVFQLQVSADMARADELLARRKELEPDVRVTITDLLTKACAHALHRHREVNVQFTDEALLRFPSANVALAVAAPQGLVVPVIKGAERLSLAEIAAVRADLVGRAREGKLRAADLEGGTFTISNLGMFGVERFIAVLNPPQAAILAVGAAEEK